MTRASQHRFLQSSYIADVNPKDGCIWCFTGLECKRSPLAPPQVQDGFRGQTFLRVPANAVCWWRRPTSGTNQQRLQNSQDIANRGLDKFRPGHRDGVTIDSNLHTSSFNTRQDHIRRRSSLTNSNLAKLNQCSIHQHGLTISFAS